MEAATVLSVKLRNLAAMLQTRPELASGVAARLEELADCVGHLEHSPIPQHMTAPLPIDGNVVRLARPAVR
jgi:hypothetical protein